MTELELKIFFEFNSFFRLFLNTKIPIEFSICLIAIFPNSWQRVVNIEIRNVNLHAPLLLGIFLFFFASTKNQ